MAATTIAALKWLGAREHPFIFWDEASRTFQPTPFGKAVLASGLPPEDCLVLKVGGGQGQGRHSWCRPARGASASESRASKLVRPRSLGGRPCACAAVRMLQQRPAMRFLSPPAPSWPQDDLSRARQSFVMTTELHLTYLCVPVSSAVAWLDWARFSNMLNTLTVGPACSSCVAVWAGSGGAGMRVCTALPPTASNCRPSGRSLNRSLAC